MLIKNFLIESMSYQYSTYKKKKVLFYNSHVQAVAAKTAKTKDRQQNFGSKTRYDNLNTNQANIRDSLSGKINFLFCRIKLYGHQQFICYVINNYYQLFVLYFLVNVVMII